MLKDEVVTVDDQTTDRVEATETAMVDEMVTLTTEDEVTVEMVATERVEEVEEVWITPREAVMTETEEAPLAHSEPLHKTTMASRKGGSCLCLWMLMHLR